MDFSNGKSAGDLPLHDFPGKRRCMKHDHSRGDEPPAAPAQGGRDRTCHGARSARKENHHEHWRRNLNSEVKDYH